MNRPWQLTDFKKKLPNLRITVNNETMYDSMIKLNKNTCKVYISTQ
jgi:hypothetical protein